MFRIAEQILGRKDSQENGTCATIFPLQEASHTDMKTSDLLAAFDAATPLSVKDILHTPQESQIFRQSLEHSILRDIVYRSPLFERFRAEVDACLPATDEKITANKTEIFPLPAMQIDESSTTGNAEVIDTMFTELGFDIKSPELAAYATPTFGDQLSISRLRSSTAIRSGHDAMHRSFASLVFGPGFFHHQMTVVHGIMETHWGDPHAGSQNPASLYSFNTSLDRKPIAMTSLPPYRVCRDLILTTLTGSLLHCLELVTGCDSLDDYAAKVTFEELKSHVTQVYDAYVRPTANSSLRQARHEELERLEAGRSTTLPPTTPHPASAPSPSNHALSRTNSCASNCQWCVRRSSSTGTFSGSTTFANTIVSSTPRPERFNAPISTPGIPQVPASTPPAPDHAAYRTDSHHDQCQNCAKLPSSTGTISGSATFAFTTPSGTERLWVPTSASHSAPSASNTAANGPSHCDRAPLEPDSGDARCRW